MTEDSQANIAPYGPPAAVLEVIRLYRQREVPDALSETTLLQLGVKDSLVRLVWRSLEFLGLLLKDGTTTEKFRALRYARDDDYSTVLGDILSTAYKDVIAVAPPESATRPQLMNAFRPYSPASQHDRMVTLFLALCKEAKMAVAQPAKESSTRAPRANAPRPAMSRRPQRTPPPAPPPTHDQPGPPRIPTGLEKLDAALLAWLSKEVDWGTGTKKVWFDTFKAIYKGLNPEENIE